MFTQHYRTSSTRRTMLRNWTKQMQILWIISLIQCRCDGNHWHQMQHCTSGTFSDGCRSASSRTQNRKRGSILSKQRPLHVNCSMDTSTGPAKQKKKILKGLAWTQNYFWSSIQMDNIKWPCIRLFLHSGSHLHFECSLQVSWPSLSSCAVWKCPPNEIKEKNKSQNGHIYPTVCRSTLLNLWLCTDGI